MTGRVHQVFPVVEFTHYHTSSSQTLRLSLTGSADALRANVRSCLL